MKLPYAEKLDTKYLGRLFDNKSESYKLFWFEALVEKVSQRKEILIYDEIINEMIASAWYMVSEYHLNLGPRDALEQLVKRAYKISQLKVSESKNKIIEYLEQCKDKEIIMFKRTLIKNVPYRLQSPFIVGLKGNEWNIGKKILAERINKENRLLYYFESVSGLKSKININQDWFTYLYTNKEIVKGWIEYNKIIYLQRRNPSVPGIAYKLYPEQARDLKYVTAYWKEIIKIKPVVEIYADTIITKDDAISIDHFIPWSYVAHDELWNLSPTTRSLNSQKSNCLPKWNKYFVPLCEMEYEAYKMVWKYSKVHDKFEKCLNNNINSEEVKRKLYREHIKENEFKGKLEELIFSSYHTAECMGFRKWEAKI
jgi:hypothetical protein